MSAYKTCRNCHEKDVTVVAGFCAECRHDINEARREAEALTVPVRELVRFSPAALRAMGVTA